MGSHASFNLAMFPGKLIFLRLCNVPTFSKTNSSCVGVVIRDNGLWMLESGAKDELLEEFSGLDNICKHFGSRLCMGSDGVS